MHPLAAVTAAAEAPRAPQRNPDEARALLPAMGGLLLLAVALVVFAWWAGSFARRRLQKRARPVELPRDQWALKPLQRAPSDDEPRGA